MPFALKQRNQRTAGRTRHQHPHLTPFLEPSTGAAWLPDGKRIIVAASEPGHQTRLYLQELDQGAPMPVTPEGVRSWVVSPDGSTIAGRGPGPAIRLYQIEETRRSEGYSS